MALDQLFIGFILLPPFIGALLTWFVDFVRNESSQYLSLLTTGITALTSLAALIAFLSSFWEPLPLLLWSLFDFAPPIHLIIAPDALGLFMTLVASILGFLIAIFSIAYMRNDEHPTQYWFFIQLFIGGMDLLVLSGDLILLYIGWEIVGLCSYGLISHWRHKPGDQGEKAGQAGIKAFIFTRIGDMGLLIAIILIFQHVGSVYYSSIAESSFSSNLLTIIGVLFLMAAFGKSAQFPFIPWLSSPDSSDIDAMQGPTTVSALIHAATMVKAGVYLISRIFLLLPLWRINLFLWIFTIIASTTALIAALSAVVTFDIKRILAYSTVSQLAYMFMGLSLAFISMAANDESLALTAFLSAQFHLLSHALFKSLLFLSAGYLIHEYGSRDLRDLRGVAHWHHDKIAAGAFLIGGLALAGIPPMNGFFSKEALIGSAYAGIELKEFSPLFILIYIIAVLTALVTAIYVTRMLFYLLVSTPEKEHNQHLNSRIMPSIMVILSTLVLLGGLSQLFLPYFFQPLIGPAEFHALFGEEVLSTLILTLSVIITIIISWAIFSNAQILHRIGANFLINWLAHVAGEGFYLEALWMRSLIIIKKYFYAFRRTHSGNLNDMIFIGSVTGLSIIAFILGGRF